MPPRSKSPSASRASQRHQAPDTTVELQDQTPAATSTTVANEQELVPDYMYFFDSTRIASAGYNKQAGVLFVQFVRPIINPTDFQSQGKWTYTDVPENVWRNLRRSASPGKFVDRVLNNYNNHPGRWDA